MSVIYDYAPRKILRKKACTLSANDVCILVCQIIIENNHEKFSANMSYNHTTTIIMITIKYLLLIVSLPSCALSAAEKSSSRK